MATAKKTVTEQVPGLQQAPEEGKFVVRKAELPENADPNTYPTHEVVLVINGEDEYTVPLNAYDDGNLQAATYQVVGVRRETLRRKKFETNDEVELTP